MVQVQPSVSVYESYRCTKYMRPTGVNKYARTGSRGALGMVEIAAYVHVNVLSAIDLRCVHIECVMESRDALPDL